MEDKFKYDVEGQLAAVLYLRTIGTISSVTDYNGHVDNINAVVYANQLYNKMNPEPDKHKITYYELHGEEQPSKGVLEEEIKATYTEWTEEQVKQYVNDIFYGGKDGE